MSKEENYLAVNMITMKKVSVFKKIDRLYRWARWTRWSTKKRDVRFVWQRLTRGWDDGDTFSLDYSVAKVILPRLKRFRQLTIGTPANLEEKEWQEILDKMIASFEFAASEERWNAGPEDYEKHNEGLDLFAKHYWSLWW